MGGSSPTTTVSKSYSYQGSGNLNIDAYAEWKQKTYKKQTKEAYQAFDPKSEFLEITADVSSLDPNLKLPKVLDLEVLVESKPKSTTDSLARLNQHFIWQKFGELKQGRQVGSYRWNSQQLTDGLQDHLAKDNPQTHIKQSQLKPSITKQFLANRAVRIRSRFEANAQMNYPLCIPLASTNFTMDMNSKQFNGSRVFKFFKNLGFQVSSLLSGKAISSVFRNWQIKSIGQDTFSSLSTAKETLFERREFRLYKILFPLSV